MDADRNLLFGVLALQAGLIDAEQFIEACLLWAGRKDAPLADLLIERGWIAPDDKAHLDYLLGRKLQRSGGDVRASLAALPDDVRRSLAALDDEDIRRSVGGSMDGAHQAATVDHVAGPHERYSRLRLHATGGIGRVWLAHDGELGRDIALKELRPEQAGHGTRRARFLQEARITCQLEHPGVVPVYELVRAVDGRQPFYTMRFVKGRTLSEAARAYHKARSAGRDDALGLPALLNAFVTVCNTVAYAHSRGVIHRDLKGPNVILGDFGEVVVLDWGLAKLVGRPEEAPEASVVVADGAADSGYTVQGEALGTPAYMAPEQAAGQLDKIDRRTDVYGLGAILYEILTGVPPVSGSGTEEVLRRVQEEGPVPPRQLWPDAPPALEALCLRALAKRPEDRPAAAADLAREVQGWQEFERRKAEEALRVSEALYHSLVESLPCSVWRKDLDGRFTFANQHFCDLFGGSLDQLLGKNDFDIGPRELAEKYRRDDQKVIAAGDVFEDVEEQLSVGVQGDRYVHTLKTAVRDAGGKIVGVQGLAWDVTARKRAEEELRKSRERFELAVQGSQDGLWDWDLRTGEVYYSPRYKAMLGYADDELPNRSEEWTNRVHPDDRDHVHAELVAESEGRESLSWMEFRMRHKDGSYRWIRSRAFILRDAAGRIYRKAGSHEDITDRKNAEEELRKSRERFELAVAGSQDGLWDWDLTTDAVYYSPRYKAMLGYEDHEMPNRSEEWTKRIHPDDLERVRAELRAHFKSREALSWVEFRMRHKDGSYRWIRSRAFVLRDATGRVYRMAGSHEDVTDRKNAEEALAYERRLVRSLTDTSPDFISFKDREGRYTHLNHALFARLRLSDAAQFLGKTDHDLFDAEHARQTQAEEEEIIRTGSPVVSKDVAMTWPDGRATWCSVTKMPLRDLQGRIVGTFAVARDITERKRTEEALRQTAERLARYERQPGNG
ncbi:MAG TPA: PAS domain S-box protein [Gemmataceae bacterium]|nr:PAS domain S-box protein [Gemmataceae bacterium]